MSKLTRVKCNSTIGLMASVPGIKTHKLVKIAHDKMSDGSWNVYVESGHNLTVYKNLGIKNLSQEEIEPLFSDDSVQEFRNLAGLFGITA